MKPIMKKLLMSAFAAVILLPGVSTITATAQGWHHHRPQRVIVYRPYYPVIYDPFYDPWDTFYYPSRRVVNLQEWGYREGRDEGDDDAEDGRPPNPTMNEDYYKSGSYAYRQAFIRGYYDGYRKEIID